METTARDVWIGHHGRQMRASLFLPEAPAASAVVFSHGFNGSRLDFAHMAQRCARAGMAALCFDFCGGSVRDKSGFPTLQMTLDTEREDLNAAIGYVMRAVPSAQGVVLFGGSQGGLVSLLAADGRSDVRGLALLFPALCIPDDWRSRFPDGTYPEEYELWGMKLGRAYFACACAVDAFAPFGRLRIPVLLMHGTRDEVVPLQYSRRAAALCPSAALVEFAGEGHGFSLDGERRAEDQFLSFLKEKCLSLPNG